MIRKKGIKGVPSTAVTANVSSLNVEADDGFKIAADLEVVIEGIDQETAQDLIEAAHQVCPYSKATRGNIEVNLKAV